MVTTVLYSIGRVCRSDHYTNNYVLDPKGRLESGGEVWVLLIKQLKLSDSGSYVCELNTDPILRSIHILNGKYSVYIKKNKE